MSSLCFRAVRLYSGSSSQFIEDTVQNQIAGKLQDSFLRQMGHLPSRSEVAAWTNSLRATALAFQHGGLTDHGVLLEYQVPLTSRRLDCLLCGRNSGGEDHAVLIELKQWTECRAAEGEHEVETPLGGNFREHLHPSVQAQRYKTYLTDVHPAFYEPNRVVLDSCAYLHNYTLGEEDPLLSEKFLTVLEDSPMFTASEVDRLERYLKERLSGGRGLEVLPRIETDTYRPSRQLMDHVSEVIAGRNEFILMDDQLVVRDRILTLARQGFHNEQKTVVIVNGGPGTGKSAVAINVMADLLRAGYNTHYATGSRAFTETLRKKIGVRGAVQFTYFNSYTAAPFNSVDVLIADEAHRIRRNTRSRFTPREARSDRSQIEELLSAAKVAVFFLDDDQVVRPDEIGSSHYIREEAKRQGCRIFDYELQIQFRCAGSEGFVQWVDHSLGLRETATPIWSREQNFDFRIFDTPRAMEMEIRARAAEGYSARMTAGFCWPWSAPRPDGTLEEDVVVGDFRRPWNAKPDSGRLAKGIPSAKTWAFEPGGIDQVGCVYTAQGFEFDYVGVIFGRDLHYDREKRGWSGHPEHSYDSTVKRSKERFTELVKHAYRVLLTRGMKGCYLYCVDEDTARFFRSHVR